MSKRERYLYAVLVAIKNRKWNNGRLTQDVEQALKRAETL